MQRVLRHTPFGPAILAVLFFSLAAFTQTPAPQGTRPLGAVTAIDRTTKQFPFHTTNASHRPRLAGSGGPYSVTPGNPPARHNSTPAIC